jgi:hypothetical protein
LTGKFMLREFYRIASRLTLDTAIKSVVALEDYGTYTVKVCEAQSLSPVMS